jgi:NAD(P)-dependent dehydrogenase (short-subunit alcohol dehydrogenase family)
MTRTAIVVGAGGDAGRAICLALSGRGFHVVGAARDRARLDAEFEGAAAELGPRGVHVAHVIVDGKIWGARTRRRFPDAREADCLAPADVAAAVCALIEQPRSAWTFELDLHTQAHRSV